MDKILSSRNFKLIFLVPQMLLKLPLNIWWTKNTFKSKSYCAFTWWGYFYICASSSSWLIRYFFTSLQYNQQVVTWLCAVFFFLHWCTLSIKFWKKNKYFCCIIRSNSILSTYRCVQVIQLMAVQSFGKVQGSLQLYFPFTATCWLS